MRILLVTGKGGVGKTTTAAATALRLADRGVKTLLVSTDATSPLTDSLAGPLPNEPSEVADGLFAAHIDSQQRFESAWRTQQQYAVSLVERGGMDAVTADELTVLPGLDELLALLALLHYARSGSWDALVVDCPASAETLRLLALPEALSWYIGKVLPGQPRLASGMRPLAALLGRDPRRGEALPPGDVFAACVTLQEQLAELRGLLSDPSVASVRLVLTPETVGIADARRTLTALALFGYRVDAVVANRIIPDGADPWRAQWARAQAAALAEVGHSFPGLPVQRVGYRPAEPIGAPTLRSVADDLFGRLPGTDPALGAALGELLTVRPDGADFRLEVSLPLAERDTVAAARSGDDLVLTVDGQRRVLALPSVLRRCDVVSGQFTDGRLVIRFRRNPELWPAGYGS